MGQVSAFIGQNLQFHQLNYEQFLAGELTTIIGCENPDEKEGRIELLQRITLWRLRANVAWSQVRNVYAHVIRKVENQEIGWFTDWDRFERHIYDKIVTNLKAEKAKRASNTGKTVLFCKAYQCQEGCPKESPHLVKFPNGFKQVQHICANCWLNDRTKRKHPEYSPECPLKEL